VITLPLLSYHPGEVAAAVRDSIPWRVAQGRRHLSAGLMISPNIERKEEATRERKRKSKKVLEE
jgi:hypothetical protein